MGDNKVMLLSPTGKRIRIDKEKMVVCVNGEVFSKRVSPTINMLSEVFSERKKTKKKMMALSIDLDTMKQKRAKLLEAV